MKTSTDLRLPPAPFVTSEIKLLGYTPIEKRKAVKPVLLLKEKNDEVKVDERKICHPIEAFRGIVVRINGFYLFHP